MIADAELLRNPKSIFNPDIRNDPGRDLSEFGIEPFSLEMHHESINHYQLSDTVPDEIIIQFETAKNIYLYAWYVYRFFVVAEHQALTCLEMALRFRYADEIPKSYYSRSKHPMLASLFRYAIDKNYIKNGVKL